LGGCVLVSGALLVLVVQRMRSRNSDLRHSNERLREQSERDPLTGLANRRHFTNRVRELAPDGRLQGCLILLDIDHFKRINDQHGHAMGDAVLQEAALRLRQALREDDLVVRWGGEEFLIAVQAQDPAYALQLGQRLLDQFGAEPLLRDGKSIPMEASLGLVCLPLPPHGLNLPWPQALALADRLMYRAKALGRNQGWCLLGAELPSEEALRAVADLQGDVPWPASVQLRVLNGPHRTKAQAHEEALPG